MAEPSQAASTGASQSSAVATSVATIPTTTSSLGGKKGYMWVDVINTGIQVFSASVNVKFLVLVNSSK